MSHIVITWPKSRPLQSYLEQLEVASKLGENISFRVSSLPKWRAFGTRCYVVYDGYIRGYNYLIDAYYANGNTIKDPITGKFWPEGNYLVRNPIWHKIDLVPMKGFQGFRYYDPGIE